MDANWSEMDISDLTNEIARGQTIAETASFLCRTRMRSGRRRRSWVRPPDWGSNAPKRPEE